MAKTRLLFVPALLLALGFLGLAPQSQARAADLPEEWYTDFEAAKEEAKLTKRDMVVVFSASWCGPCQYMVRKIYPVDSVRKVLKEKWVPCYVDADIEREIVEKYGVRAYPTFVFLDSKGTEVGRAVGGAREPADFLKMLETKGASAGSSTARELPKLATIKGFDDWVKAVAFSPDGKTLAVGCYEYVELYEVASQKKIARLKTRTGYANALAFAAEGSKLIIGGYQTVDVYDVATAKRVKRIKGHRGYITGITLHPSGDRFATSSADASVRIWNLADGAELAVMSDFEFLVQDVAFSPDGTFLATAGGDPDRVTKPGPVTIWNAETGDRVHELVAHEKAANSVGFSPDGLLLVSTSEDEKTNLYDARTGKAMGYFNGHQRATNDALFTADSKMVISASGGRAKGGNTVQVWTASEGEFIANGAHAEPINDVALSPDGKIIASASNDKSVVLWNLGKTLDDIAEEKMAEDAKDDEKADEPEKAEEADSDDEKAPEDADAKKDDAEKAEAKVEEAKVDEAKAPAKEE